MVIVGAVQNDLRSARSRSAWLVITPNKMLWLFAALLPALAAACDHSSTFNGTVFDLSSCKTLDLSCPAEGGRSKVACANLLLPKEIIALGLALADAPSLETLSLRGSPLGKHGITTLAPSLAAAPLLHTLDLGSCRLGDAGARTLAAQLPASLRRIDLTHNHVGDDGVRAVAGALKGADATALTDLDLSWNSIGTRGGRYLGDALKGAQSLSSLSLSWNGLMDRGARAIGEALAVNSVLTSLNLEHNAIKDDGGKALAKGLRTNGALKTLKLEHNGIPNGTLSEALAALEMEPEARSDPGSGSAGSDSGSRGARAGAPSSGGLQDDDEDDIEEISFDDDAAAAMEDAAEAAADARERAAASCIDRGPWACEEDDCPAPMLSCTELFNLGVCDHLFADVWSNAPEGTEGKTIASLCCRSCRRDKEEL